MCGLVAAVGLKGRPITSASLIAAANAQRHRGPDDQGFLLASLQTGTAVAPSGEAPAGDQPMDVGLGFNRLSIIDLSAAGHQPMGTDDGSCFIVFNGEIYNFEALHRQLESEGATFRSRTDTEVILRYYERHGIEKTLAVLNGMFAFVIVDLSQRVVHVARDRFGVKPLYIGRSAETLVFASELKSIFAFPEFKPALMEGHLDEFLLFRYVADTRTLFRGVEQLRPGTYLTIAADGSVKERTFWRYPAQAAAGEDAGEVEAWLEDSVRRQLIADVPVGCQLSGGIDSSLVNLLAREAAGARLEAFSVVFSDPAFSEEPWIDTAAQKADVNLHKYTFDPGYFSAHFERATWHLEAPINHPNSLGLYLLTENAARSVKVLLSGEGADEIMGGYPRFFYAQARSRLGPLLPLLAAIPRLRRRFVSHDGAADDLAWFVGASAFTSPALAASLMPGFDHNRATAARGALIADAAGDTLSRCLNYEARTYLPELLIRQDKMTMAHSVENRVPFLDNDFVDKVRRLAQRDLVGATPHLRGMIERNTKIALKAVARRHFPEDFVYRTKAGFGVPLQAMFAHPEMQERVHDQYLPGIRKRGIFDPACADSLWSRKAALAETEINLLWTAIAFEAWAQQFLDASPARPR
ncbi:asparagine synthase (glutamine-hydrolyzing) [Qipengyuania sediminis]|uniref:asparagine synthase (glutamine-hydrolyzing) n=1 Tax=Qipengyuania sediminis TaxID=1532023 RepID=UPI001059601B|nr:asparagine synthase (glutamine-hydrolyzing) [Qipengyuania sediminis]